MKDDNLAPLVQYVLDNWSDVRYFLDAVYDFKQDSHRPLTVVERKDVDKALWKHVESLVKVITVFHHSCNILADYLEENNLCKSNYIKGLRRNKLPLSDKLLTFLNSLLSPN